MWCSEASRASRSRSTASIRRASWTSRSTAALDCSASRWAPVRSSLTSCWAASRSWSASRWALASRSAAWLLALLALLLGLGHQPRPVVVELLGVDDPQVLGVAAGVGLDRLGVAGGLLADLVGVALGDRAHLGGLLLGQAEHRARAAAEPGVRRLLGLGDLAAASRERGLELADPRLGAGRALAELGVVGRELAQPGVDGVLVVAAAADRGQRRQGRGRGGGGGRRRAGASAAGRCCAAGAGGITGRGLGRLLLDRHLPGRLGGRLRRRRAATGSASLSSASLVLESSSSIGSSGSGASSAAASLVSAGITCVFSASAASAASAPVPSLLEPASGSRRRRWTDPCCPGCSWGGRAPSHGDE